MSLFLVMVVSALVVVVRCLGPRLRVRAGVPAGDARSEGGAGDLTREEQTQFDGRMGRPRILPTRARSTMSPGERIGKGVCTSGDIPQERI